MLAGCLGALLFAAWLVWLTAGRITVLRTSERARLEVSPAPTKVAVPVSGRIVDVNLAVGTRVRGGDMLVALDATSDRIALKRAKDRLVAIEPELASVAREVEAETAAGRGGSAADQAIGREVLARQRARQVTLRQAEEDEARTRKMVEAGVQPTADLSRAISETNERRAALDALSHEAGARSGDRQQREAARNVRREQLERQRAELEAVLATIRAEIDELTAAIERRTVRSPIDGVLGEVAALRPGSVLAEGTVVATVVPDGTLQVVAEYGPAAIGRIAPGQPARVRLDGFPWTHYGTLRARVARVGSELREERIRVELTLDPGETAFRVTHGMTGSVEIEVERASPAELLIRAIGEGTDR